MRLLTLPTWEECHERVGASSLTSLERFVYDNEPAAPDDHEWRAQLREVLVQQVAA